jgi:hypothetical protein
MMHALFAIALLVLQAQRGAPPAPDPAVLAQFDFLVGEYDFTYTATSASGATQSVRGVWAGHKIADGKMIEDTWVLVDEAGKPRNAGLITFRTYDTVAGKWRYKTANLTRGTWSDGAGVREGDEIHLLQPPAADAGPNGATVRIRYYHITPDGFSWIADISTDGGKTWHEGAEKIEAKRRQ